MSSSRKIRVRKIEEIDTIVIRDEPPPSESLGYVLIYKNDKFPKKKLFSKEGAEPTIGSVKLESQFKRMISLDIHTKMGLLMIYASVIGGLAAVFYFLYLIIMKPK